VRDFFFIVLKRFEGWLLKPYLCPAGVATIAAGATTWEDGTKVKLSDPSITDERARELTMYHADLYIALVLKLSPVLSKSPLRLIAVADFCYNLGIGRYKASTLKRRIDAEDWDGAASEMAKWVWGGGKKLPGLIKRRAFDANLLTQ
jgi:lysozyme